MFAAAALALLVTLALTSATQLGWIAPSPSASEVRSAEAATALSSRVLQFADGPKGTVVVTDATSGATVHVYGEEGSRPIPPSADLVFQVELVAINPQK